MGFGGSAVGFSHKAIVGDGGENGTLSTSLYSSRSRFVDFSSAKMVVDAMR